VGSNSTARPLPGGQPLSRDFIAQHQRTKIIAALAEEASEQGYRAVTIADIVRRAGIARNTFYENFGSKEDCFLVAQQHAVSTALGRVIEAAEPFESWPERVCAGLTALLEYMIEEPALARICVIEALAAGPASVKCHQESQQAFASLFRVGRDVSPQGAELPETLEEAIVGGLFWIVYRRLVVATPEAISELLPQLIEFTLTPYLGAAKSKNWLISQLGSTHPDRYRRFS
jgi:AcrR family transcriptional regulator